MMKRRVGDMASAARVSLLPPSLRKSSHPEACIEVGFPLADVKMKEAAN
jgi:hypothetical protein